MPVSTRLSQVSTAENLRDRKLEENLRDRPRERPIFQGFCVSILQRRSWHHCRQLGDLLCIAGGVGSDATAEAVDGRAKAMQLDVVGFGESRMEDG